MLCSPAWCFEPRDGGTDREQASFFVREVGHVEAGEHVDRVHDQLHRTPGWNTRWRVALDLAGGVVNGLHAFSIQYHGDGLAVVLVRVAPLPLLGGHADLEVGRRHGLFNPDVEAMQNIANVRRQEQPTNQSRERGCP